MLPNFFVVGAAKAGTSSLYEYLRAHPQVYMSPVKEPSYYALQGAPVPAGPRPDRRINDFMIDDRDAYEALFDQVNGEIAVGEASTAYLASAKAAARIHEEIPHAKIVAVLRDPCERARSAHSMYLRLGIEPIKDFAAAVDAELAGENWRRYVTRGFYSESIERYQGLFGRDQVSVFLYEDLHDQPRTLLRDLFRFIDVDPDFAPNTSHRYNVSTIPKNLRLHQFTNESSPIKDRVKRALPSGLRRVLKSRVHMWNAAEPPSIPRDVRGRLVELYRNDICRTEELIGRDLTAWRHA